MLVKKFVFSILIIFFLVLTNTSPSFSQDASPSPSPSPVPTVEVEIGPVLDKDVVKQAESWFDCLYMSFGSRFPFDFVGYDFSVSESGDCPSLEIFDSVHEACFVVDAYSSIRPIILGGLMVYGIFHL